MRAHVISTVAQADLEILVAEDLFLLAKDGVCELGVEGRNVLEARLRRRDEADIDGIVGVGQPWRGKLALNAPVQEGCRRCTYTPLRWAKQPFLSLSSGDSRESVGVKR